MQRKRKSCESTESSCFKINDRRHLKVVNLAKEQEQLSVTIMMGTQRTPITINVPKPCNMKILKSMLWFHLKKILTTIEYSQIIGFESMPTNFERDYQLQKGIGQLQTDITLTCFFRDKKYQADSLLSYKICKLISLGGFSKVYLLRSTISGDFFTGKFILKQSANLELVENQFKIASSLDHPFIVKTHHFIQTQHFYVIVMEFVSGGQLFQLLRTQRTFSQADARFYILETLIAIRHLHHQNIIYRDIKPENIILDHQGHLKLTDFGLAKKTDQRSYSFCGSIDYMAPEVLEEEGYSFGADHYSLGNLLFQLLIGSPPFYHPNFTQQQTRFHISNTPIRIPQKIKLSASAISLLKGLLQKQPSRRLGHNEGIDEILKHEWFQGIDTQGYLNRCVQAPFRATIKMQVPGEESSQRIKQWQNLIDKDLKKLQIKTAYQTRKNTNFTRQSLDSQHQYSQKYRQIGSHNASNSKLKSNISLLYVLTHKRSTSEFPRKNNHKFHLTRGISGNLAAFKSLNLSRKNSFHGRENRQQSKDQLNLKQGLHSSMQNSCLFSSAKTNKENKPCIRKKRSQVLKTFTKINK